MRLAIMQPYLFPYIGYFQLINAVDEFIFHDDVQFIKGGWINRNRILQNGKDIFITLGIKNDSAYKNINERFFSDEFEKDKKKLLRIIENSYHKAPNVKLVLPLLDDIFSNNDTNVSSFIIESIKKINHYIEISTPIKISSCIDKNNSTKGEERVIELCKACKVTEYINPIGGITLYLKEHFENVNIKLKFLQTNNIEYKQFSNQFIPYLSIIDVLMFNEVAVIKEYLTQFTYK